jgi:hypothetical protein
MVLPKLPYNFHDAEVALITVGPRREVTLVVSLDDPARSPRDGVYIRFGGITNFSEVAMFFEQVPFPREQDAYRARINGLDYDPHEESRWHNLVFQLEVNMVGAVRIRCRNVSTGCTGDVGTQTDDIS